MRWLLLTGLAGCSNPYAACAGGLTGTFDGAGGGTVSAQLTNDGELSIALVDADGNALTSAVVPVDEDGSLATPSGQDVRVDGAMDLESCTGSGTWASLDGSGGWTLGG
jgi:hypothetical protein